MSRLPLLATVAALGLAAPALAAQTPPAKAAPKAAAAAPAWIVDKAQSRIGFRSTFQGAAVEGGFRNWDAQIAFDPRNLAGSRVSVTIDVASVTSTDSDAQEGLPSADWFDARRNPRATFVSNSFRDLGGGRYQAVGTLTLRGVSQQVVLPFTLQIAGNTAKMNGSTTIDRSKFGVGQGQFRGPETIPFAVTVNVAVTARRR
jgi:polyisoprenoid-binding protein YceI